MAQWYLGKIAYHLEQKNGTLKSMQVGHLVQAVSFTDGEATLYKIAEELKISDWSVRTLACIKLSDVFHHASDGENWYLVKVVYLSLDERRGKEKRVVNQMVVNADDVVQAVERVQINLKNMLIPYVIEAVKLMAIVEVHTTENES